MSRKSQLNFVSFNPLCPRIKSIPIATYSNSPNCLKFSENLEHLRLLSFYRFTAHFILLVVVALAFAASAKGATQTIRGQVRIGSTPVPKSPCQKLWN